MRRVIFSMGIPISVDIPECSDASIFDILERRFHDIDARFSTYKENSEVSRFQRGELTLSESSKEFRAVEAACTQYERLTNGYFSAYYTTTYDPTGYVKGWAIHEAGVLIQHMGFTTYLINAAGDIEAASSEEKVWHIGIQHPFDHRKTIGTVSLKNGAVATSGTYERGMHITDPHTGKAAKDIVSTTIWGAGIIEADVFATTAIAMGVDKALDFIRTQHYNGLLITPDGAAHTTSTDIFTEK